MRRIGASDRVFVERGESAKTADRPEFHGSVPGLAEAHRCVGRLHRYEEVGDSWAAMAGRRLQEQPCQTKNGDGRIVYLNKMAVAALQSVLPQEIPQPTQRPFEDFTPTHVSVTFSRICARLSIQDFRFHDLRHTAASWLRMQGADIHTVALLLGHKDLRMAARYQHLSPSFLSDAVKLLDSAYSEE